MSVGTKDDRHYKHYYLGSVNITLDNVNEDDEWNGY